MDITFYNAAIAWPADNKIHCITKTYSPPVFKYDVGIAVNLKFGNTLDQITMYKALVVVVP